MGPQGELEAVDGGQHCRDPDQDSVYRITLTVGTVVDMGWVAPGGDEFSMSGSIEKSLGRRCWSRIGVWTLTFGEVRYPGTDDHLRGWELEAGPGRG